LIDRIAVPQSSARNYNLPDAQGFPADLNFAHRIDFDVMEQVTCGLWQPIPTFVLFPRHISARRNSRARQLDRLRGIWRRRFSSGIRRPPDRPVSRGRARDWSVTVEHSKNVIEN